MEKALVMPQGGAIIDSEEMTYVDGGQYFSGRDCTNFCIGLGISGAGLIAAAGTAAIASKIFQYAKNLGGFWGGLIIAIGGVVVSALGRVAYGIGYGATSGRGVYIETTPWPWECFVNVHN